VEDGNLKKVIVSLCLLGLLLIAGCGGGDKKSSKEPEFNPNAKGLAKDKVLEFITAVKNYDADGMLDFLDVNKFKGLTFLAEGVVKSYSDLKSDLEGDKVRQLLWFKPLVQNDVKYSVVIDTLQYDFHSYNNASFNASLTIFDKEGQVITKRLILFEMLSDRDTNGWVCTEIQIENELSKFMQ